MHLNSINLATTRNHGTRKETKQFFSLKTPSKWTQTSTTRCSLTTDAELAGHITSLPSLPNYSNMTPLSSRYLAKGYADDELKDAAESMKFASQLGIHIPHIQRILQADDGFYCIMDRIPGTTLDTVWPELGWITSLRVASNFFALSAACGQLFQPPLNHWQLAYAGHISSTSLSVCHPDQPSTKSMLS